MDSSTVQHTLADAEVLSFCKNGYLMYKAVVSGDINKWVTEFLEDNDPTCLLKEDRFIEHVLLNPEAGGAVRALLGENFAAAHGDGQPSRRRSAGRPELAPRRWLTRRV